MLLEKDTVPNMLKKLNKKKKIKLGKLTPEQCGKICLEQHNVCLNCPLYGYVNGGYACLANIKTLIKLLKKKASREEVEVPE